MPNTDLNITTMIESFVRQLFAAVEASTAERAQAALAGAFGFQQKRGPGRPAKQTTAPAVEKKKAPKQLCPVPGCKNPAAPVFGMVCKDHKKVSKAKIRKYREARKAGPVAAAKPAVAKKAKKFSAKASRARKIQGQYLGSLRSLKGEDRKTVKQVAKEKGVAEALKLALSLKKT
jgi:hypothetical protein